MDPKVEVIETLAFSSSSFPSNSPHAMGDNDKSKNRNKLVCTPNSHPQAMLHEVIDIDEDEDFVDQHEDSMDVMVLDQKIATKDKGKAIINDDGELNQSKDALDNHLFHLAETSDTEYDDPINTDELLYDDDGDDGYMCFDDLMDFDEYSYLQSHFDNVNIPAGVEAPIPWFLDSFQKEGLGSKGFSPSKKNMIEWDSPSSGSSKPVHASKKSNTATGSNFQKKMDDGVEFSSNWPLPQASRSKKMPTCSQQGEVAYNLPPFLSKRIHAVSSSSSISGPGNQLHNSSSNGVGLPAFFYPPPSSSMYNQGGFGNLNGQGGSSNLQTPSGSIDFPGFNLFGGPSHSPYVVPQGSWINSNLKPLKSKHAVLSYFKNPLDALPAPPSKNLSRTPRNVDRDAILTKLQLFKQFGTVEDYSDHQYSSKGSSVKQGSKSWAKKIMEEWRILQNDLPDNIYVRAYEARMDLLRAVIVGAEGTPYHDGLFFFDILFPGGYPNVPPLVYYHSGGLRINPNLYNCGKVCLSLLGTWQGNKNEKWIPGVSTVLQVLVSVQGLILNQNPFFNEPGYECRRGTSYGEIESQQYNEKTFLLSLKTMIYTLRKPPKHFEDFVMGHFHKHAHDILVACRSYIDGAQVGSLVKGGVQDVNEGDKSCSKNFRDSLPGYVDILVEEFMLIGVEDCEKYLGVGNTRSNPVGVNFES